MRDNLSNKLDISTNLTDNDVQAIRQEASQNIRESQAKQKQRYDAGRIPATKYQVGDLVKMARNNYDNNGKSTKLLTKFIGPFKILEILGNDRYRVTDVPGFSKKGKSYNSVIAADRLRPWINVKALEVHDSDPNTSTSHSDTD